MKFTVPSPTTKIHSIGLRLPPLKLAIVSGTPWVEIMTLLKINSRKQVSKADSMNIVNTARVFKQKRFSSVKAQKLK